MSTQKKSLKECSLDELVKELIARGDQQVLAQEWLKFKETECLPETDSAVIQLNKLFEAEHHTCNDALAELDTRNLWNEFNSLTDYAFEIKRVFGFDHRMDWYNIRDEKVKRNTACVVGICNKNDLIDNGNGFSTLKVRPYAEASSLSRCVRFHSQTVSTGLFCTGSLVTKDVVATAGHRINANTKVEDLRFVFGYKKRHFAVPGIRIPNEDIYQGSKFIDGKYVINGPDWALVRLDREVIGQEVAEFPREKRKISDEQAVYVIGHPRALPLKYAPRANVCGDKNNNPVYFEANLDTLMGNSGSPVFNSDTHEVEGILVSTPEDYEYLPGLGYALDFEPGDCSEGGAIVIRFTEFIDKINDLKKEKENP